MNDKWRKIVQEHGPSNYEEAAILRAMGEPTQEPWPASCCPSRSPSQKYLCCLFDGHDGQHRALAAEGDADLETWGPTE